MMTTDADPLDGWYDLIAAAQVLDIHPQSLRRLIKRGEFPAKLVFGKYVVFREALYSFAGRYDNRPGRKPSATILGGTAQHRAPVELVPRLTLAPKSSRLYISAAAMALIEDAAFVDVTRGPVPNSVVVSPSLGGFFAVYRVTDGRTLARGCGAAWHVRRLLNLSDERHVFAVTERDGSLVATLLKDGAS